MTAEVKILNLGLFRTGTSSLCLALRTLGYNGVYHMDTIFSERMEDSKVWLRAFDIKYGTSRHHFPIEELLELLRDCEVVSDLPAAAFAPELLAAYPQAKVIVTIRDSAEHWQAAAERTVWHVHAASFFRFQGLAGKIVDPFLPSLFRMGRRMFCYLFEDDLPRTGAKVYAEHLDTLKRLIPPDRLLIFNVKEGWEPLCKFLGHDIPKTNFPHVNDGATFIQKVKAKQEVMLGRLRFNVLRGAVTLMGFILTLAASNLIRAKVNL